MAVESNVENLPEFYNTVTLIDGRQTNLIVAGKHELVITQSDQLIPGKKNIKLLPDKDVFIYAKRLLISGPIHIPGKRITIYAGELAVLDQSNPALITDPVAKINTTKPAPPVAGTYPTTIEIVRNKGFNTMGTGSGEGVVTAPFAGYDYMYYQCFQMFRKNDTVPPVFEDSGRDGISATIFGTDGDDALIPGNLPSIRVVATSLILPCDFLLSAKGGDGTDGQNGGKGGDGINGRDVVKPDGDELLENKPAYQPHFGGFAGNGGDATPGGYGGNGGIIEKKLPSAIQGPGKIITENRAGLAGVNGIPGQPGTAGLGGQASYRKGKLRLPRSTPGHAGGNRYRPGRQGVNGQLQEGITETATGIFSYFVNQYQLIAQAITNSRAAVLSFPAGEAAATFGMRFYLSTDLLPADNLTGLAMTVSCWLKPANGTFFFYGDAAESDLFDAEVTFIGMAVNGNTLQVSFKNNDVTATLPVIADEEKNYFIVVTCGRPANSTDSLVNIYVDGNLVQSKILSIVNGNNQPMHLPMSGKILIGTNPPDSENNFSASGIFEGYIHDLRIWNKEKSAMEVTQYGSVPPDITDLSLILALPLDEANTNRQTQQSLDLTGRHNAAYKKVYDNPGNLYISSFNNFPATDKTVACWMRNTDGGAGWLLSYGDYSNSHDRPNDGQSPWYIMANADTPGLFAGMVSDGNWHHLAVTVQGNVQSCFADGLLIATGAVQGQPQIPGQVFLLGAKNADNQDDVFNGQLKQLYICNKALTQNEIIQNILPGALTDDQKKSLVAYLPLKLPDTGTAIVPSYGTSGSFRYEKTFNNIALSPFLRHFRKITSRSALAEEYINTNGTPMAKPVYRVSVTLDQATLSLKLWASENITIEAGGVAHPIGPQTFITLVPNIFSKIHISMDATDVYCPRLMARADWMSETETHYFFPDVEAHKKIMDVPPDQLKTKLSFDSKYTDEDINGFQKAIQNVNKTVQHTYNRSTHGLNRDRKLLAKNMQDPHFVVHLDKSGAAYQSLTKTQVASHTAGADKSDTGGFFANAASYFSGVTKIVLHTVHDIQMEVVDTAAGLENTFEKTTSKIGEDIVHGDIKDIGQTLIRGGENVAEELVNAAGDIVVDTVADTKKLLVLTLHTAEKVTQYVFSHTGEAGKCISVLLHNMGVKAALAVDWLLDKIDWAAVLSQHTKIETVITDRLTQMGTLTKQMKDAGDDFLNNFSNSINQKLSAAVEQYIIPAPVRSTEVATHHSGMVEKIEWLLSKFSSNAIPYIFPQVNAIAEGVPDSLILALEDKLGKDGAKVIAALKDAGANDIHLLFAHPATAVNDFLDFFMRAVKAVVAMGLDALTVIFDWLLKLGETLFGAVLKTIREPWNIPFITDLYKAKIKNEDLNLLNLVCLFVAIPLSIVEKATSAPGIDHRLGNRNNIPLAKLQAPGWSYVYGICHILLGIVTPIVDLRTIAANAEKGFLPKIPNTLKSRAKASFPDNVLALLGLSLNTVAQVMANPLPPDQGYRFPAGETKGDVYEASNYWSHAIWVYQWFGWSTGALATVGSGTLGLLGKDKLADKISFINPILTTLIGITHLGLMITLRVADDDKSKAIKDFQTRNPGYAGLSPYDYYHGLQLTPVAVAMGHTDSNRFNNSTPGEIAIIKSWTDAITNYANWDTNGGISGKFTSNFMDTLPEMGQLGSFPYFAEATEGVTFAFTALLDFTGHLAEGSTVLYRTYNDAML